MFVRLYLIEVENDISPAVLCLCHKIKDIHFAMFFRDQCNLKDRINDHTRLHIESEVIL